MEYNGREIVKANEGKDRSCRGCVFYNPHQEEINHCASLINDLSLHDYCGKERKIWVYNNDIKRKPKIKLSWTIRK